MDPRIGTVLLDKYRLDAVLGCGGMGVVYRATQLPIDRPVAIKLITCDVSARRPDTQQRFRREAEAMAKLRHPNTVRLFDFGITPDSELFIVMELLEGRDLAEHLTERGALPLAEALQILRDALGSLSEAHAGGIVHRDIKPANIYLSRLLDGRLTVKLMDFGVASIQQSIDTPKLTIAGAVMGTPAYMSPEQASGRSADARSDLYSLGITLFQMLTGRVPFEAESVAPVLVAHLAQPVPRLSELCPDSRFDPSVQALLDALLHKSPEQRPANASEALQLVEALIAELHASKGLTAAALSSVGARTPAASSTPPISVPKTMLATMLPGALRQGTPGIGDRRWLWASALALGVLSAAAVGAWRMAGPAPRPADAPQERSELEGDSVKSASDIHFETSTSALTASAEPSRPAAEAPLSVVVRSSPNAALVSRSGRELGRTPLSVTVDQPMRLTLKLPDYQAQDLILNADSKPDLTVKLLPMSAVGPAPAPPAAPAPAAAVDTSQRARAPSLPPPPPQANRNLGKTLSTLMSMPRRERQQYMLSSGAPYTNVVTAKQALRDDIVDSALYKDIIWVLKTQREQRIDAEKLKYKFGAITRDEYDRRVDQIDRNYEGK